MRETGALTEDDCFASPTLSPARPGRASCSRLDLPPRCPPAILTATRTFGPHIAKTNWQLSCHPNYMRNIHLRNPKDLRPFIDWHTPCPYIPSC